MTSWEPPGCPISVKINGFILCAGQYSSHSHQLKLPECAASGCKNFVYHDPLLGKFDYCSPKCRDEHLLPSYNKKLKEDIASI